MTTGLPVEIILPDLVRELESCPAALIQAPPGSGKTTCIPLALLEAPYLAGRKILMLEPRRLAAVNAARWMARSLGEEAGETVGYAIRFERKVSPRTRLEILTEALLVRRLQQDPLLEGVGVVIFDEFHERSIHADTALALCLDIQRSLREDLRIIIMSATINSATITPLFENLPLFSAPGTLFPIEYRYLGDPGRDIPLAATGAICRAVRETEGDILVFLPGAGEIRRCRELLADKLQGEKILVATLYGDMPFDEQERAILPAGCRKVVLATNIAETSLTIQGVRVVIDSGLARQLRFDPSTGLNRLVTGRISRASATQRAGRGGRLGPGVCYRLWNEQDMQTFLAFDTPEIRSADLCELALNLALWGVRDAADLNWVDSPPVAHLAAARRILAQLAAVDGKGQITPLGRKMAELPLHPRLARLVLQGVADGDGHLAADLAALLSERDIMRQERGALAASSSDIADRLETLYHWRRGELSAEERERVDVSTCKGVDRVSGQLRRLVRIKGEPVYLDVARGDRLVALAYPERIAMQRTPGSDRYLLANGSGGRLGRSSAVTGRQFIVAVHMGGGDGGEGTIYTAAALTLNDIRELFATQIGRERKVRWDPVLGRVTGREELLLGALILETAQLSPTREEALAAISAQVRESRCLDMFPFTPVSRQLQARVQFLRKQCPESDWPDISDQALAGSVNQWLATALGKANPATGVGGSDMGAVLQMLVGWERLRYLEKEAPSHVTVPTGSRISLDYTAEDGPVLAVKLQELFGLGDTPTVATGRVRVLLHLLSPARRPIQVTRDLRSFWNSVYPEVKKELKGRYPRHPWPDDPWSAQPVKGTKKR